MGVHEISPHALQELEDVPQDIVSISQAFRSVTRNILSRYKAWVASWRSALLESYKKHSKLNRRGAVCKNRVETGFAYDKSSATAAVLKGQFKDSSLSL